MELVHLRSSWRRWRASVKASQGTSLSTCPCPALLWPALPCPPCPLPHFRWKQHQSNLLVFLSLSTCPCPPSQLQLLVTGISQLDVQHLLVPQSTIIPFFPYNGLRSTSSKVHLTMESWQQLIVTFPFCDICRSNFSFKLWDFNRWKSETFQLCQCQWLDEMEEPKLKTRKLHWRSFETTTQIRRTLIPMLLLNRNNIFCFSEGNTLPKDLLSEDYLCILVWVSYRKWIIPPNLCDCQDPPHLPPGDFKVGINPAVAITCLAGITKYHHLPKQD